MRSCDLRILEAATISIALVIFCVFWTLADLTTYLFCAGHELLLNALRPALRQAARRYQDWVAF